jgi:peptidoglycan-N-acetylglucosamine deacetylase
VRFPRPSRALLIILSAVAGGTIAHLTGNAHPQAASASALPESTAERAVQGPRAEPEPVMPPAPIPDDPHEPEPTQATVEPEPRPHDPMGSGLAEGRVISGATPHRLILFSFDDGPDLRHTPRLLQILDDLDVKAVFFMTAERIAPDTPWGRRQAELAREVARRGHIIGNHTLDHSQLPLLDNVSVLEQLRTSEAIFERVFGSRPWLLRPPGGARSERVDGLVEGRGYTQVMWNLGSGDFQVRTAEEVVATFEAVFERRREEQGERGGVILLHDIHEWSVEAVPLLVRSLRDRNCELLARGEELYDIVDDPSLFFEARGKGDAPGVAAAPAQLTPQVLWARQARARSEARRYCADDRVASNR